MLNRPYVPWTHLKDVQGEFKETCAKVDMHDNKKIPYA